MLRQSKGGWNINSQKIVLTNGGGRQIIPKNEVYAEQDNTSKSEFIWLRGGVMCLSFVALTRIRG